MDDVAAIVSRLRSSGYELADVEVKAAQGGLPHHLDRTVSAFANGRGGLIILGLAEAAGFAAVGVPSPAAARDQLVQMCAERLTPPIRPHIEIVPFEGARLVVAEIDELSARDKPCFVSARGRYEGSFVRSGDGSHRMTPYEVDRLSENQAQPRWDLQAVGDADLGDLDAAAVDRLLRRARGTTPRSFDSVTDDEALLRLGVVTRAGDRLRPTVAGLMSIGAYPQQFFPQLMITLAVHPTTERGAPGPGGERFLDSRALTGPIPAMVVEAVHAVQRNLRTASVVMGAGREDLPEISPEVIREAVVNALMHRDYSDGALGTQVQIDLFPDRLEVSNAGGLYGNVRPSDLGESGISSSRNARLAALLQEVTEPYGDRLVAENRGSGLTAMVHEVLKRTAAAPFFRTDLAMFRVTVLRSTPLTRSVSNLIRSISGPPKLSSTQEMAIAVALAGHNIDVAYMRRLGASGSAARREIHDLLGRGVIEPVRARGDEPYRIASRLTLERTRTRAIPLTRGREQIAVTGAGSEAVSDEIVRALRMGGTLSRRELDALTGYARSTVTSALSQLVRLGVVVATAPPRSPYRRYRLADRDTQPSQ